MSDPRKKLCVVFDIDETLIQMVQSKYKPLWDNLDETVKSNFNFEQINNTVVIFRPHIAALFEYFKATPDIKVGLWTYSEREYSMDIANLLTQKFGLPENFFMFTWGAEDIDEDSYPKELTAVYNKFPDFNKFNTFLVDDLYKNISHKINAQNSILVQPFAPFGTSKVRTDIGREKQLELSRDTAFNDLKQICQKVLNDIKMCEPEDIDDAFTTESVFDEKRVNRIGLSPMHKTYAVQFIKMITLGAPMEVKTFIMVEPDKYGVHVKGGTYKRKRGKDRKKNTRRTNK